MELKLKPSGQNRFDLNGILIKGSSAASWLLEIQRMELALVDVDIYPVPGATANSIFGCLVISHRNAGKMSIGKNEWCQQASSTFFMAERAELFPAMRSEEMEQMFGKSMWLMHPEIGLAELTETLDVRSLILMPETAQIKVTRPHAPVFIPREVKSFHLAPVKPEDVLEKLEAESFPKREKMENKPLNLFEKVKLAFYKMQFTGPGKTPAGKLPQGKTISGEVTVPKEKNAFGKWMDSLLNRFPGKKGSYAARMQQDFENLEERNKKQIDKLLDMLRKNPNEALKYAIPLNEGGSARGGSGGKLNLSRQWSVFSVFGNHSNAGGSGGSVDMGDHFYELQKQYKATAEALIQEKEYGKAAFIYMKLLKDTRAAASTLENGGQFQDAASVYLKHLNDKAQAAICYEKGNLITNAIDLYKELKRDEKVGDLYVLLNNKKEAHVYYEQAADELKNNRQYLMASLIYRNKMQLESKTKTTLLQGWREEKEAVQCLKAYLSDFNDADQFKSELTRVYQQEVTEGNQEIFLQVLKQDVCKGSDSEEMVREMAYEIVADRVRNNPYIVKELKYFNPENKGLTKDMVRFAAGKSRLKR